MKTIAWPINQKLHLMEGHGVPLWLHSFAGYIVAIGRNQYKLRIPVDDNTERWVSATQLQLTDPWGKKLSDWRTVSIVEGINPISGE